MADEEQPFLGSDPYADGKHTKASKSIRERFRVLLSPKYRVGKVVLMTLVILAILAVYFSYVLNHS